MHDNTGLMTVWWRHSCCYSRPVSWARWLVWCIRVRFSTTLLSERRNDSWHRRIKALTIKSLQLLRAVIYNEIVKLP